MATKTRTQMETEINVAWALRDGRNPYDAFMARVQDELDRVEAMKAQPMIEMDEAIAAGKADAHANAFAVYEIESRWAAAALKRGDKIRADHASKAAWRKLGRALKAVR